MPTTTPIRAKLLITFLSFFLLVIVAASFSMLVAYTLSLFFLLLLVLWLSQLAISANRKLEELQGVVASKDINAQKDQQSLQEKNQTLEDAKRAVLNILEDTQSLETILQQERDQLQAVLRAMADGVLVFSPDQKLVLANQAALKMLDLSEGIAIGLEISKLCTVYKHKQPLPLEEWPSVKTLLLGKPFRFGVDSDLYLRSQSGRIFPISATTALLTQDNKIWGVVLVIRDITFDKNLDEAKSNFISTASHQLRTPLTSMRWFAEMLLIEDAGKINKDQKYLVEQILNSSTRMISLVGLLLQIARIEAGSLRLNPQVLDIQKMTESLIQTFKGTINENQQKIKLVVEGKLPTVVMDQVIVWQVMQNILSNASKYSPKKSLVTIRLLLTPTSIQWSVTDKGIGIPKEQQSRIFEKFFRADNAVNFAPEGSGLGLPLVKSLVEGWGGKIWFETVENQGTTFYVTMPLPGLEKPKDKMLVRNIKRAN